VRPSESRHGVSGVGIAALALVALLPLCGARPYQAPEWRQKVHPRVLDEMTRGPVDFVVFFDEQADLSEASRRGTKQERGRFVFETLREVARRIQAPTLAELQARGLPHRSFWIANMIWVRGTARDVEALAARGEVLRVDANPRVRMQEPLVAPAGDGSGGGGSIEWGLEMVQADEVWALGFRGGGVVIGGQDTGYDWDHPAIIEQYRGWNGLTADHDYNWHDSIHADGGSCGPDTTEPCDDFGHGTHTMGTMVGDDGGANRIGMSPDAKWIACRNMNVGDGTPATYSECFEWLVAPTDLSGANPQPDAAPDVINNSWVCPPSEGCEPATLQTIVGNTRAAGIVVVASAGNSGSACGSVDAPPATYDASFSIGATDSGDEIAGFSARGPVTVDGSGRLKPDVSAPGVSVRSSVPGGGYASSSGTSMAGPHVAGLVALLLSARPDLKGRVAEIETLITLGADPKTTSENCGGIPGTSIPNNTFGHGRINALETLTGDPDADGVGTLTDCLPVDAATWAAPGEAVDLRLAGGAATALSWTAPVAPGSSAVRYDVVRSDRADDFSAAECVEKDQALTAATDDDLPEQIFYYLVRANNGCGANLGQGSGNEPRDAPVCDSSGGLPGFPEAAR